MSQKSDGVTAEVELAAWTPPDLPEGWKLVSLTLASMGDVTSWRHLPGERWCEITVVNGSTMATARLFDAVQLPEFVSWLRSFHGVPSPSFSYAIDNDVR